MGSFELLAHIEVDWVGGRRWSVTPPTLCMLRGGGGNAFLVGARTAGSKAAILECLSRGVAVDFVSHGQGETEPSAWYIGASSWSALETVAASLNGVATSRADQLYDDHYGDLEQMLDHHAVNFSHSGFQAERLDINELRFQGVGQDGVNQPGCYRQISQGRNVYWFVSENETVHRVNRWLAVHAELSRQRALGQQTPKVVGYDPESLRMRVDARAQLPIPWARVAMACTGLSPTMVKPTSGPWFQIFDGVEANVYRKIRDALNLPKLPPEELSGRFE